VVDRPVGCRIRLAELVKIDPKAIGVGQYQHDLGGEQTGARSARCGGGRDCVKRGRKVDAKHRLDAACLARGIGDSATGPGAKAIVQPSRRQRPVQGHAKAAEAGCLGLGRRAFEQCAGFPAQSTGGDDPLDASGGPSGGLSHSCARSLPRPRANVKALIGNTEILRQVKPQSLRR